MAAVDYFLKLEGIEGESTVKGHEKEIDVLAFSWGVSRTQDRVHVEPADFQVVKNIDKATPALFEAACSPSPIAKAVFSARTGGAEFAYDFFKIRFSNVFISSVSPGGSAGSDAPPMDQFKFQYDEVEIATYDQQGQVTAVSTVTNGLCLPPRK
jgi:type VI secretion system secreted protein Hcp